jgi:glucose dehydrogenase
MIAYLHSEPEGDEFDNKFRAFGNTTAIRLWQTMGPFSANATAAIFEIEEWQNMMMVADGPSASQLASGVCVTFALPE